MQLRLDQSAPDKDSAKEKPPATKQVPCKQPALRQTREMIRTILNDRHEDVYPLGRRWHLADRTEGASKLSAPAGCLQELMEQQLTIMPEYSRDLGW